MKFASWLAIGFSFATLLSVQADIILSHNVTYTQNFDTLASAPDGGTGTALPDSPNGWTFVESGGQANTSYGISNGGSSTGNTYSFGTTASTDRAFGALRQDSGGRDQILGARFVNINTNTKPFTKAVITYTGEQWRLGATGRVDRLDFQISTDATSLSGTGTWTDVDSLDFTAPVTTGSLGAKDGNAAANRTILTAKITLPSAVSPGQEFWIRWNGFDASGADDGLAVDDFSIRAIPGPSSFAILGGTLLAVGWGVYRRRKRQLDQPQL